MDHALKNGRNDLVNLLQSCMISPNLNDFIFSKVEDIPVSNLPEASPSALPPSPPSLKGGGGKAV